MFNLNNYSNVDYSSQVINPNLPQEFHITAKISIPYTKIVIGGGIFWAFIVLESIIYLFIGGSLILFLLNLDEAPEITLFPMIDFAIKAEYDFYMKDNGPKNLD